MPHEVFISCSTFDRPAATEACAALERHGITCWIAPRDEGEMDEAIAACRAVVLILSARANQSGRVRREMEAAVNEEKAIVPVRVEDVKPCEELEYALAGTHALDAFPPPLEGHLPRLVEAVNALLDEDEEEDEEEEAPAAAPATAT